MRKTQPRINLAAFGKHPGWEDHIPGIGLETAGLAQVKQTLYVTGIGGQIDAGAWEPGKLEPDKRVAGFDHWFLWSRASTLYCGRFWSSRDRVGRKEYPMVLCVESTGIPPGVLLSKAWPELERLRQACLKADTSDRVLEECRASQEHFRRVAAEFSGPASDSGAPTETKRGFVAHPELGPDRLGLLRVLHELERTVNAGGRGQGAASDAFDASRSYHLRVPRACDTEGGGLLLWLDFFRCALPSAPTLLLARAGAGWLDIVFGEPASSDLYCLQTSPKALPLATEIPYELDSGLAARLKELEARFLSESPGGAATKSPPPAKPEPPPSSPEQEREASGRTERKGGRRWWLFIIAGVLVVIGIPLVWMAGKDGDASSEAVGVAQTEPATDTGRFEALMAEGSKLVGQGQHADAVAQFDQALAIRPNDENATKLKDDAEARLAVATAAQETKEKYEAALGASQAALTVSNWTKAILQANLALAAKPGDAEALKLKTDAQKAQAELAAAEQAYAEAVSAAKQAVATKDYAEAIRRLDEVLKTRPQDTAVVQLRQEANTGLAALTQAARDYQAATNAAKAAFDSRNYGEAIRQADLALGLKPEDAAALKLKTEVQRAQAAAAQAGSEYESTMNAVAKALEAKDYAEAIRQADAALAIRPGDPAATESKANARNLQTQAALQAQYDESMTSARAAFGQKDYANALQHLNSALTVKPGDPNATALKADAQRMAQETLVAQQYDQALQAARAALERSDYQSALDQAEQALKARPDDATATELKARASAGLDLRKAKDFIAAGEYAKARGIYDAHSGDAAFAGLPKAIQEAQSQRSQQRLVELDAELQKLLVRFNVLPAKDPYIQSPEARRESWLGGRIGAEGVNYYLQMTDRIETGLAAGGWLDQNDREKYLEKLRKAIPLAQ